VLNQGGARQNQRSAPQLASTDQLGGVFLSYRTGDGDWAAVLLMKVLSANFGASRVFLASSSIRPGEDFTQRIAEALSSSGVLLAIIGPRWLSAVGQHGYRRLDDPDDWVHREIAEAFRQGVDVIPVLLDNVERLAESDLPPDLARLANCQYVRLRHRYEHDIAELVTALAERRERMASGQPD